MHKITASLVTHAATLRPLSWKVPYFSWVMELQSANRFFSSMFQHEMESTSDFELSVTLCANMNIFGGGGDIKNF